MRLTGKRLKKMVRKELVEVLKEQDEDPHTGWEDLPPGWDESSVNSFVRSLTGVTKDDPEGLFTKCVEKIEDEEGIDDPERFCAAVKDQYLGTENWRGED